MDLTKAKVYKLDPAENIDAEVKRRIEIKKERGLKVNEEYEKVGAYGEYGICRMLGMPFNRDFSSGTDNGIDIDYYGLTIDVKTVSNLYSNKGTEYTLQFPVQVVPYTGEEVVKFRANIGILAYTNCKSYVWALGYILRDEFLKISAKSPGTNKNKREVCQDSLRPMSDLFKLFIYD